MFNSENYIHDIKNKILVNETNFDKLNNNLVYIMNKHAPFKTKIVRGNVQAHMTKELRKEIMKRSRLKNIYKQSKLLKDFATFKKQRNHIVTLNRKQKKLYFSLIDINKSNNAKGFWDHCKPFFTNKSTREENNIIYYSRKESDVAHIFNDHFKNITKYFQ